MPGKLTSQDIIDRGEYLEPDFDPSTLTIAHLHAVLANHDVKHPTNAKKPGLIKLFQENIAPNARKYKKEREMIASIRSDGSDIYDVGTGSLIEFVSQESPVRKRVSRKSAVESTKRVPSTSPVRKSRKSLATPRTSTKPAKPEEDVTESESEHMASSRNSVLEEARKPRRVSQKWGAGDETSLWEDRNPFQRSSPPAPKPRKSRARESLAPKFPPSTDENIFPAAGELNLPKFPISGHISSHVTPNRTPMKESVVSVGSTPYSATLESSTLEEDYPYVEGDSQTDLIRQKIAALGEDHANGTLVARRPTTPASTWRQFVLALLLVLGSSVLWAYKNDSAMIGYCDPGSDTNIVSRQHLQEVAAAQACKEALVRRAEQGTPADPDMESCQTYLIPRATKCTPCPPHAICSIHTITCEPAYMLRRSALSSIPLMDALLNGMPGLGPVALPARCVADVRRRQTVGKIAKMIENKLAVVRGERVCAGVKSGEGDVQEAAAFGVPIDDLRAGINSKVAHGDQARINDIFDSAIQELKQSGLIVSVKNINGRDQYASIRSELSYVCQAKLKLIATWHTWQRSVIGSVLALLMIMAARSNMAKKAVENRKVKGLVKDAIERVRAQEAYHYLDSVKYPSQSLTSLQLRDELMQDEHSIAKRARIWHQVEKIVEENSNIRSNMEVTPSGDEGRVWTWIGAGGARFIDGNTPSGRQVI
ncbi:SubName: Full=Uncharacterized protein {ECO:0000313/EMBL:CCA66908.1} [Serendipita indica DSM 11827]|nr:SubName: Full=Uncharacterized protein {ECO:0000313/EMBL:CCA66908.1} [Serendipita indica DSM 11827]